MGKSYYLVNLNLHLDYSWLIHPGVTIYLLNLLNPNRFLSSPSDFPELMWRWMITSACYPSSTVRQIFLKWSCQHSITLLNIEKQCAVHKMCFFALGKYILDILATWMRQGRNLRAVHFRAAGWCSSFDMKNSNRKVVRILNELLRSHVSLSGK